MGERKGEKAAYHALTERLERVPLEGSVIGRDAKKPEFVAKVSKGQKTDSLSQAFTRAMQKKINVCDGLMGAMLADVPQDQRDFPRQH